MRGERFIKDDGWRERKKPSSKNRIKGRSHYYLLHSSSWILENLRISIMLVDVPSGLTKCWPVLLIVVVQKYGHILRKMMRHTSFYSTIPGFLRLRNINQHVRHYKYKIAVKLIQLHTEQTLRKGIFRCNVLLSLINEATYVLCKNDKIFLNFYVAVFSFLFNSELSRERPICGDRWQESSYIFVPLHLSRDPISPSSPLFPNMLTARIMIDWQPSSPSSRSRLTRLLLMRRLTAHLYFLSSPSSSIFASAIFPSPFPHITKLCYWS